MPRMVKTGDRTIWELAAIGTGAAIIADTISGSLAIIMGSVAVVLLVRGFMSYCPLYRVLGLSARGKHST